MMNSISRKLILAFLLVAVIAAVLVAVVIRLTSPVRLNALLRGQAQSQLESLLTDYYGTHGSFAGVAEALVENGFLPPLNAPVQPGQPPALNLPRNRLVFALADENGVVILSMLPNYSMGTRLGADRLAGGTPIRVNDQVVGTLFTPPDAFTLTPEEQAFLDRTNQALWLAAGGAIAAALVTGILLAGTFTRPLRSLTSAARRMAEGELKQEVPVRSQDEIGQLTRAFNRMSQEVSRADQLRQQMTADIAHDLRTPLTVIGGYVESMQEGVLEPTPERLAIIRSEIERLQSMVEDLRTLSRADAGELVLVRQPVAPGALLEHIAGVYRHAAEKQQVHLVIEAEPGLPEVQADEARLNQVLGNLIDNALRYTPKGGTITLSAARNDEEVSLTVQDTGAGIPSEDLPHIFERFYRADKSRSGADTASGLGLAIARALVLAHGGEIHAESTPGQGTKVMISLPVHGGQKVVV